MKSADEAEDNEELDEEAIRMEMTRYAQRQREALVNREYQQKLKESTLETFTDKPEPIDDITLLNATPGALVFEW